MDGLFELEMLAREAVLSSHPRDGEAEAKNLIRTAELQAYQDVHGGGEPEAVLAARREARDAEEAVKRLQARLARSRVRGKGPRARALRSDPAYRRKIKSLTSQLLAARLVLKDKAAELEAADGTGAPSPEK